MHDFVPLAGAVLSGVLIPLLGWASLRVTRQYGEVSRALDLLEAHGTKLVEIESRQSWDHEHVIWLLGRSGEPLPGIVPAVNGKAAP